MPTQLECCRFIGWISVRSERREKNFTYVCDRNSTHKRIHFRFLLVWASLTCGPASNVSDVMSDSRRWPSSHATSTFLWYDQRVRAPCCYITGSPFGSGVPTIRRFDKLDLCEQIPARIYARSHSHGAETHHIRTQSQQMAREKRTNRKKKTCTKSTHTRHANIERQRYNRVENATACILYINISCRRSSERTHEQTDAGTTCRHFRISPNERDVYFIFHEISFPMNFFF